MNVLQRPGARRRRLTGAVVALATLASLLVVAPAARADDEFDVGCDVDELIFAIEEANVNGEEDIINLEEDCEYVLTEVYTRDLVFANGLPVIFEPFELTINGNGATIERDEEAAEDFRILQIVDTGILVLNDLSIENGSAIAFLGEFGQLTATAGGIFNAGDLAGVDLEVTENSATASDSQAFNTSLAGGIYNTGTLELEDSTVSNNDATTTCDDGGCDANLSSAGGIQNNNGTVTLEHSSVSRNRAIATCDGGDCGANSSSGGGIQNIDGIVTLEYSSVSRNRAIATCDGGGCSADLSSGGGIENASDLTGATLIVEHSRVRNNLAVAAGFSVFDSESAFGGGIASTAAELTVEDSKVYRNWARASLSPTNSAFGGGIASSLGTSTVTGSRLQGNRVTALTGRDSNTAMGGGYFGSGGTHELEGNAVRANVALAPGGLALGGGYAFISGATVTIESDAITENVANAPGGTAWGGGIYVGTFGNGTTVTVTDSEITENEASGDDAEGGGVYVVPGNTLDIFDSEVDDNEPNDCFGTVGGDGCEDEDDDDDDFDFDFDSF